MPQAATRTSTSCGPIAGAVDVGEFELAVFGEEEGLHVGRVGDR